MKGGESVSELTAKYRGPATEPKLYGPLEQLRDQVVALEEKVTALEKQVQAQQDKFEAALGRSLSEVLRNSDLSP